MAVNVSASAQGSLNAGQGVALSQIGATSPAGFSAALFLILIAVVVLIAMGLR